MADALEQTDARAKTGPVQRTLMFTDIEGSTALLHELGDAYGPALRRHQDIVRARLAEFSGEEDSTAGDSFFALFEDPAQALGAAINIHRDLKSETWPGGATLKVRIGLHHGQVEKLGKQCVGLDVHMGARVGDSGNGGQTVLSSSAFASLPSDAAERWNVTLRPLGAHRLKDMRYPEKLYDLADEQVGIDFPPIRSLENRSTNITRPRGPIIGRDREISEVLELLDSHTGRLVSIVGAGGTGKTTVAERIAALSMDDYREGTYVVDMSGLDGAGLVFSAVAQAMGVRDFPGRSVEEDIASSIDTSKVLLVLDTFEYVLDAGVKLTALLSACPNLRILVTSRVNLDLAVEKIYPLAPLDVPQADDPNPELAGAMRLFVEMVREDLPEFAVDDGNRDTIATIVRRLEGIPLALSLAAARMALLSPEELLSRLDARLKLLRGGRKDVGRHRTLRDAIEWSDGLLEEDEREVFQDLSVFAGGFRLGDAEDVLLEVGESDADVMEEVGSLVSKNLVHRRLVNGVPRFGMYDMIREYAGEALSGRGRLETLESAYVEHYARLAETSGRMALNANQARHVVRLYEEADNIRTALRHAIEIGDIDTTGRMISALYWYWISQGQFTEGLRWMQLASELAKRTGDTLAAARIHLAASYTNAMSGDYESLVGHSTEAVRIYATLDAEDESKRAVLIDTIGAAVTGQIEDPTETLMGCIAHLQGCGDMYFTAVGLIIMGEGARMEGEKEAAEECYGQALQLLEGEQNTFWPGLLKQNIAHFRLGSGDVDGALSLLAEAYDIGESYDYPLVINLCVAAYGGVALARGNFEMAARFLGAVDHHMERIGASFEPTDKADIDGYVERTREALGEAAYATHAAAGAAEDWNLIRSEARTSGEG